MSIRTVVDTFFSTYPTRIYAKGEVLIRPDEMPPVYYVASGLVMQYGIAKNGNKHTLNLYKPGAFVSFSSFLNNQPSALFFEASEHTTVHVAPAHDVVSFLKSNPDVVYDALQRISRGGEGLMLRLSQAMEGSAEDRILQELQIMRIRFYKGSTVIPITDTDLAVKTGLARETVSRTLKKLDNQGIISARRGQIIILDTTTYSV